VRCVCSCDGMSVSRSREKGSLWLGVCVVSCFGRGTCNDLSQAD
jgi:hypothetical protein